MPGEDVHSWSTTAADNDDADTSINWAEGMARAAVNDSMRAEMAAHAKERDRLGGMITTTGTADAQVFDSGGGYVTVPTGMRVLLKIGAALTNTTTTTLTMDGIGAVTIKNQGGADLVGGELRAGAYAEFRYDGTNWILLRSGSSTVGRVAVQVFTASGTYTPAAGMIYCIIEGVGGGGGGGAAAGGGGTELRQGGGGGSGGYSRKVATATTVGASQVVTIGAAGAGGIGGNGGNGGTTSVGALMVANGGTGGAFSGTVYGIGGTGGAAGTGDFTPTGASGSNGSYSSSPGVLINTGKGADSTWGGGGWGGMASGGSATAGTAAAGYGGGGGGASTAYIASSSTGGAGTAGAVVITEFIAL